MLPWVIYLTSLESFSLFGLSILTIVFLSVKWEYESCLRRLESSNAEWLQSRTLGELKKPQTQSSNLLCDLDKSLSLAWFFSSEMTIVIEPIS